MRPRRQLAHRGKIVGGQDGEGDRPLDHVGVEWGAVVGALNIPQGVRHALDVGASFVTLGQLSSCRDFLAGTDVAGAVLRAARSTDVPPLLNVGRGVAMSCRSMVELLAAAAGFEGDIFESHDGAGHATPAVWQQADLTLTRRHLQWVPTTSIAEAVSDLWKSGS